MQLGELSGSEVIYMNKKSDFEEKNEEFWEEVMQAKLYTWIKLWEVLLQHWKSKE